MEQSNTKPKQKQARSYPSSGNESAEESSNKLDNPAFKKHKLDLPKNESDKPSTSNNGQSISRSSSCNSPPTKGSNASEKKAKKMDPVLFLPTGLTSFINLNYLDDSCLKDLKILKDKFKSLDRLTNLDDISNDIGDLDIIALGKAIVKCPIIRDDKFKNLERSPSALNSELSFEEYWSENRSVVNEILKEETKFTHQFLIDKVQQMLPLLSYVVESKIDPSSSRMIRTSSIIYNGIECFKVLYYSGLDEPGAYEKCARKMLICLKDKAKE